LAALSRVANTDQGSGTANVSALERQSPRAEIALQDLLGFALALAKAYWLSLISSSEK
jgi:hypothetical protein